MEMVEVVAREQRRLIDVGAGNMGPEMPDHGRAEGRHDVLAAHILADSGPAHVVALLRVGKH
jgi:hypothetical protein